MKEAVREWKQLERSISEEKKLVNLKNGGYWDNRIELFEKKDKLPEDKTISALQTRRQNWYQEVEQKINQERNKWDQLEAKIKAEKILSHLASGGYWDQQIQFQLNTDYLIGDKTISALQIYRENRYQKVKKEIDELEKIKKEKINSLLERSKELELKLEPLLEEVENILQVFNEKITELSVRKKRNKLAIKN